MKTPKFRKMTRLPSDDRLLKITWKPGKPVSYWSADPETQAFRMSIKAKGARKFSAVLKKEFDELLKDIDPQEVAENLRWIKKYHSNLLRRRPISVPLGKGSKTKEGK